MLSLESRKRRTSRAICWPAPERHGRSDESGAACAKLQSPLLKNKMRTAVRIGVTAAALILMLLYWLLRKSSLERLRRRREGRFRRLIVQSRLPSECAPFIPVQADHQYEK